MRKYGGGGMPFAAGSTCTPESGAVGTTTHDMHADSSAHTHGPCTLIAACMQVHAMHVHAIEHTTV